MTTFCFIAATTALLTGCSPAKPVHTHARLTHHPATLTDESLASSALPPSGWKIELSPTIWQLEGFEGDLDLSGIATADGKNVLLGSDELLAVQPGTLDPAAHRINAAPLIPLLENPTGAKIEIDIEGVAYCAQDHCYYITGSHGVGKKKGEYQPARASVFRLPTDPASGQILPASQQRASLMPWLEQSSTFRDYVKQPLQLNGFNLEGLTSQNGKLFFGVRSPNVQGNTYLIETTPASLFGPGLPQCTVHSLPVGETRGIRELAAVRGGLLVLTGNASAEATKKFPTTQARSSDKTFDLFLWSPTASPPLILLGPLPPHPGKAEALLVLADTPTAIDLLILYDGAPAGGPQSFRLIRP